MSQLLASGQPRLERHNDPHHPVSHRNLPMTQRQRPGGKLDRSWTMTRTGRTRPTSRERVCSSNMMSGGTPRRRSGTHPSRPQVIQHQRTLVSSWLQRLCVVRPKNRNRKLWKDEGRWEHDRFREEEQAPKSREELIAIYGYDIRNGSGSGERSYRQRRPR